MRTQEFYLTCQVLGIPDLPFDDGQQSGNWGPVSEDLVDARYLDTEIILLLQGKNATGESIFSYVSIVGAQFAQLALRMRMGSNFKPTDFGTVLAYGTGEPPQWLRHQMGLFGMIEVPAADP